MVSQIAILKESFGKINEFTEFQIKQSADILSEYEMKMYLLEHALQTSISKETHDKILNLI